MTRRLVKGSAVLAFVLGSAASVGCGGSSGDKALAALDSLPNAPLDSQTTEAAASNAASTASSAAQVPQASDYGSSGTLPSLWAMGANKLPLAQRPAALAAAQFLGPQAVSGTCPVVTDNSNFQSGGTLVDVTVDAGTGCTPPNSTVTLSGSMTLYGHIDAAAGSVSVDITVKSFTLTAACTGGSVKMSMDGTGSTVASGLVVASTSFTITEKLDVTIGFSGSCGGQSASGSGFISANVTLSGTKSGNTWTFTISNTNGTELYAGARIGEYAQWKGTLTVNTQGTLTGADDTGTIALSGRVGWDTPFIGKGKIDVALNGDFSHAVCTRELVNGSLQLTSGSDKAVVSFDGNSPTPCNQAPWTLNGAPQGVLIF